MISKIKCFFGFHNWKMIDVMAFVVGIFECKCCGAGMRQTDYSSVILRWLSRQKISPAKMKEYDGPRILDGGLGPV